MKKILLFIILSFAIVSSRAYASQTPTSDNSSSNQKRYYATGEVLNVSPVNSRITIKHGAIKGFSADDETEFFVTDEDILKKISSGDLVDFEIADVKGDARIDKITRTGIAPEKTNKLEIGKAVQDVLEGTGEIAKAVVSPITPASPAVDGAVNATTNTTGAVLDEADGAAVKQKF